MATVPDSAEQPKSASLAVRLAMFIVMTLISAGAGWGVSMYLDTLTDSAGKAAAEAGADGAEAKADSKGHGAENATNEEAKADRITALTSVPLEPIITNIAEPKDTWIRLELSVQFENAPEQHLVDLVTEDLLTFVRTIRLDEVSAPSGFLHFKSDLAERAAVRSEGKAKSVLVKAILFE